ncbi:MAG: hypothetical protein ABFD49_03400 [Armatimonadota bacterium]|nr:hypothetical protein [bacterium]
MLCHRCRKLLISYSENSLDEHSSTRLERHLAHCDQCRCELEMVRSVSSALRQADNPAMEPAPDLWAKVNARISDEPTPAKRSWIWSLMPAGVAAVLVAVIALAIIRPGMQPQLTREVASCSAPQATARIAQSPEIAKSAAPASTIYRDARVAKKPVGKKYVMAKSPAGIAPVAQPDVRSVERTKSLGNIDGFKASKALPVPEEPVSKGRTLKEAPAASYTADVVSSKAEEAKLEFHAQTPQVASVSRDNAVAGSSLNSRAEEKLDNSLRENVERSKQSGGARSYAKVVIQVKLPPKDAINCFEKLGLSEIKWDRQTRTFTASAPVDKLQETAQLNFVVRISPVQTVTTDK